MPQGKLLDASGETFRCLRGNFWNQAQFVSSQAQFISSPKFPLRHLTLDLGASGETFKKFQKVSPEAPKKLPRPPPKKSFEGGLRETIWSKFPFSQVILREILQESKGNHWKSNGNPLEILQKSKGSPEESEGNPLEILQKSKGTC